MTEYKCGSAKSCKYGDMCKPNFNIGVCLHYKAEEPQTNEEWFCSLPTEEKVNALLNLHEKVRRRMRADIGSENSFYRGDYYREWLKEIHHEV